jgi:hypothetical protein
MQRDWIEEIFIKALEKVNPDLLKNDGDTEALHKLLTEMMPEITQLIEKDIINKSKRNLRLSRSDISKFKKRLFKRWRKAIDLLEVFIFLNIEYGERVSKSFRKSVPNVKFETLLHIHARACQIASEILDLIKNGYADGAMARWRTLHEISVISKFLVDNSDDLINRYLDYQSVESYFEMIEYQRNYGRLDYEPIEENEMNTIEKEMTVLKNKYGSDFLKPYGWLGDYLPKNKWSFAGIEEFVHFNHMRPFYKMANNNIHSGAKSMFNRLGIYKNKGEYMLAGPSNYGLADPGQNAAYSLLHVTLTLSNFETYLEDAVFTKVLLNMADMVSNEFGSIQKEIEKEEDELDIE